MLNAGYLDASNEYQEVGILFSVGVVMFAIGVLIANKRKVRMNNSVNNSTSSPLVDTQQSEIASWGTLLVPWCASVFINIVCNLYIGDWSFAPQLFIGIEFFVSAIMTYSVIRHSAPELLKLGRPGAAMLFLIPMSSVFFALILSLALGLLK